MDARPNLGENARILSGGKSQDAGRGQGLPAASAQERARARNSTWIEAFKGGKPTYGDFLLAGPISEAFNLGAISLRLGGKRLRWDAANMKITNLPDANKFLTREYRKGWELAG